MQVLVAHILQTLLYILLYGILYNRFFVGAVTFKHVSEGSTGYLCEGSRSSYHLRCDVVNLLDNQSVYWYRKTQYEEETVIYRDQELLMDGLTQEEQSVYTIGIHPNEIEILADTGSGQFLHLNTYTCKVIDTEEKIFLSSSGLELNVLFPPGKPECIQEPPAPSLGAEVYLTCRCKPGNPPIDLQWTRNDGIAVTNLTGIDTETTLLLNYSFILQENDYDVDFSCQAKWKNCDGGSDIGICSIKIYENDDSMMLIACLSGAGLCILIIILVVIFYRRKKTKSTDSFNLTPQPAPAVNTVSASIEIPGIPGDQPIKGKDNLPSNQDYMTFEYRHESEYYTLQNTHNEHEHELKHIHSTDTTPNIPKYTATDKTPDTPIDTTPNIPYTATKPQTHP